jgi:hypothetical protein
MAAPHPRQKSGRRLRGDDVDACFFGDFLVLFMSDVRCPNCGEGFRLPDFSLPAGTIAACPWCKSRHSIATLRAGSPPLAELFAPDGNPLQVAFSLTDFPARATVSLAQPAVSSAQPILASAPNQTERPLAESTSHHTDRWATPEETPFEQHRVIAAGSGDRSAAADSPAVPLPLAGSQTPPTATFKPATSIPESDREKEAVSEIVERFTTQLEPASQDQTTESRKGESRTAEPRVTRPIRTAPRSAPPVSSGLRQVIQVAAGGLLAIPLAAAILAMLGKPLPIDLGFWPFLGNSPQGSDMLAARPAEPGPLGVRDPQTNRPPADEPDGPSLQAPPSIVAPNLTPPGDAPKLAANPPQPTPQETPGGLVMPITPTPSVEPESPPRNMPQEANLYDDNYDAAAAKRAVAGPLTITPQPEATQAPSARTAQARPDPTLGTDRFPPGDAAPPVIPYPPASEPIARNRPTIVDPVAPETARIPETTPAPEAKPAAAEPSVAAASPSAESPASNNPASLGPASSGSASFTPPTPDLTLLDYAKGMVAAIKSLNEHKSERDGIAELKRRWAELYVQIAGAADVAAPEDRASMARISGKLVESGMTARVVKIAPTWVTSSRRLNGGVVAAGMVAQESGRTFIRWSGESPLEVRGLDPKLIASPEPLLVWGRIVEDSPVTVIEVTFAQAVPSYVLSD